MLNVELFKLGQQLNDLVIYFTQLLISALVDALDLLDHYLRIAIYKQRVIAAPYRLFHGPKQSHVLSYVISRYTDKLPIPRCRSIRQQAINTNSRITGIRPTATINIAN